MKMQSYKKVIEKKVSNLSEIEFNELKRQIVQEIVEAFYNKKFGIEDDHLSLYKFIGEGFETKEQLENHINKPRTIWEKFMVIGFECSLKMQEISRLDKYSNEPKTVALNMKMLKPSYLNIPDLFLAKA